jgi:hypothetical protein
VHPNAPRSLLFACATLVLASGCTPEPGPLPMLEGEGFFDRPWPSDLRLGSDGPLLDGFPQRESFALLDSYLTIAESLGGYGNNSPVYLRFHNPIDLDLAPDPEGSLSTDATILLLDIDRDSAHRGEPVPIEWAWQEQETEFQPEHLLAVRPVYGFPLRPATSYALVIREPLAAVGNAMAAVWEPDHPDHAHYQPLQEALFVAGIDVESVAAASVFTTQDPVSEMAEYASYIQTELDLPGFVQQLTLIEHFQAYDLYEGWTFAPLFQEGERPYASEGGALYRNAAGEPRPYTWEWIRFSLALPNMMTAPVDGWPLYIYSHGTGGDYITYADSGSGLEVANMLARQGLAGLGIDQPLHGLRATDSTDPEFHSFNILNPDAARGNFRQGGLDQVFLAAAIRENPSFMVPTGVALIDPERLVFLGHSQGGISGALAGPFLGSDLQAMYLSGAGGGLGQTLLYREEGVDLVAMLATLLEMDDDETVDTFHPVVGLIQWLSDVTDPINYAPYWFAESPPWRDSVAASVPGYDVTPIHVAMSEGVLDAYTPHQTTESLAAAARVPLLDEVASPSLAHELRAMQAQPRPVSGNATGYADASVTAGLSQYGDYGHFAIFDDYDAAYTYMGFLLSATQDEVPTIQEASWRPQ